MNKILLVVILATVLSLNYDEEIYANVNNPKIYHSAQSYNKRTFHLRISSFYKDYLEINNYYGKSTIIKGDKIIAVLNGQEKYEIIKKENADYYIIFEFPSPFEVCGIKINQLNDEYYKINLKSSLTFEYLQQKTFTFKIINDEPDKIYVSISLSNSTNYWVTDVTAEENGNQITPVVHKESTWQLKYIVLLTDEITFSFTGHNTNVRRTGFYSWSVSLKQEDGYGIEEESTDKISGLTYASSTLAFFCVILFVCTLYQTYDKYSDEAKRLEKIINTFSCGKKRIII